MSHIKVISNEGDTLRITTSKGYNFTIVDMSTGIAVHTKSNAQIVAENEHQSVMLDGAKVIVYDA